MIKDIKNVLNLIKMKNSEDVRTNKDWDLSDKYSSIIEELLPKQLENLSNNKDLLTTGSVGKGNYSMVPWVTTFNTNITKSTQKGYYIVYLFHPEGKGVYLSLNQGWSEIKEKTFGVKKAKEKALALSKYLASYLDDNNFEVGRFYYSNNKDSKYDKSDLPSGYAHGSIIYKYYDFETEVYTEDMMISDYKEMIKLLNG
ncbi:MrcB family domain-containing protein, partial [Staphylococcus haemolyticus]